MNLQNNHEDDRVLPSPLDRMVEAVQAEAISDDAIERVIERAKQLAESPVDKVTRAPEEPRVLQMLTKSVFGWLAAASAMLLVAAGTIWSVNASSGRAFAQVISKVKAASTVQLKLSTRFGNRSQTGGQMYLAGNRSRYDNFEGRLIQIVDFDAKSSLYLDTTRKISQTLELTGKFSDAFFNPIEQLRNAKSSEAVQLGEEILDGRGTRVFRLSRSNLLGITGDCEMLIWVDKDSELPAQIVIRDTDPKTEVEFRFEGFVWNKPIDEKLFNLTAPDGYKQGTVIIAPKPAKPVDPSVPGSDRLPAFADHILHDRAAGEILWSRDGSSIVALMRDPESTGLQDRRPNELRAWDVATGKMSWSENVMGASNVASSPDGKFLATVIGREVQIRDANTGKVVKKWATTETLSPMAFSPDGKTLIAGITEWGKFGGRDVKPSGGVQIWDLERAALVSTFTEDHPTTFVAYSMDGSLFVTASDSSGPVKLRQVADGELIRIFSGYGRAAFTPDGKSIACVSPATAGQNKVGKVDLYSLSDGSLINSLTSEAGQSASTLLSLSFSADSRFLAAADWNGLVTVWDISSGRPKQTFAGHQAGVLSVAFAPDGKTLATGSEDKTLRLWKRAE